MKNTSGNRNDHCVCSEFLMYELINFQCITHSSKPADYEASHLASCLDTYQRFYFDIVQNSTLKMINKHETQLTC